MKKISQEAADQVAVNDGLHWRIHTGNLFELIMQSSNHTWILYRPMQAFKGYLEMIGEEAIRIDDHRMNQLMIRMAIYTVAQQDHPDYNKEVVDHILNAKEKDYTLSK